MSSVSQFGNYPVLGIGQLTTANTNRAQSNNTNLVSIVAIASGTTSGTIINRIDFQATGTTTAGMLRLWLYSGTGAVYALDYEKATVGVTPSGTLPAERYEYYPQNLVLPPGWILYASTNNTENWNVVAYGANI